MSLIIILIIISIVLIAFFGFLSSAERGFYLSQPSHMNYEKFERSYRVYVPDSKDEPTEMVVLLHGYSDTGRLISYYTGMINLAKKENFIVVVPEGLRARKMGPKGWNVNVCCGVGWVEGADDSGFVSELSKKIAKEHNIATEKRFVTGFSNGAMMTQKLMMEHPDLFSAGAAFSGAVENEKGKIGRPTKPVSLLLVHGERDSTILFNGGSKNNDGEFVWQSFDDEVKLWLKTDVCIDTKPTKKSNNSDQGNASFTTWRCDGRNTIRSISYSNLPHRWPGARYTDFSSRISNGSVTMLDFFRSVN
ncbi:prolyl oligopeptidase family serine peptidase [Candidatus Saccharibacteria bacterium]|nr:prolyl oligopeptidase family serine peptidase [Candidatus Saccharibacteria bacterium]